LFDSLVLQPPVSEDDVLQRLFALRIDKTQPIAWNVYADRSAMNELDNTRLATAKRTQHMIFEVLRKSQNMDTVVGLNELDNLEGAMAIAFPACSTNTDGKTYCDRVRILRRAVQEHLRKDWETYIIKNEEQRHLMN